MLKMLNYDPLVPIYAAVMQYLGLYIAGAWVLLYEYV